jgi:hypothetical protein
MSKITLMKEELVLLRNEIAALKNCQTQYVTLTVTSVGLLFAYLIKDLIEAFQCNLVSPSDLKIDFVYLIPLIIIIPLSCIFFNKATTLFRIVGYYQLLEDFNSDKIGINKYIGWENSLRLFRSYEIDREIYIKNNFGNIKEWNKLSRQQKITYFIALFGFDLNSSHGSLSLSTSYWGLIYSMFFLMAMLCFILTIMPICIWMINHNNLLMSIIPTIVQNNKFPLLLIWTFFCLSIYAFHFNLKILYQLEEGFHSYKANYALWKTILIDEITTIDID